MRSFGSAGAFVAAVAAACVACGGAEGVPAVSADEAAAPPAASGNGTATGTGTTGAPTERKTEEGAPMAIDTAELQKKLTPLQYEVCMMAGTERPFANEYWNHKADGTYYDRISGEPLFDSKTKFDSGSGWPSFFQPVDEKALILTEDRSHGMVRVEVRARRSGAHLGHVFDDGPRPTGKRFCINSAALIFVPRGGEPPKPLISTK